MKTIRLLWGMTIGAFLMYMLDSENGKRRRRQLYDQLIQYGREAEDAGKPTARYVADKAQGLMHETTEQVKEKAQDVVGRAQQMMPGRRGSADEGQSGFMSSGFTSSGTSQSVLEDDRKLAEQVMAQLGRRSVYASDVNVEAHGGRIYLTGSVDVGHLDQVLEATRDVAGVNEVVNQLHPVAH